MEQEISDFIERRFKENSRWKDGNCYYFAVILADRFDFGEIWYDIRNSHFVYGDSKHGYYDWEGKYQNEDRMLIRWSDLINYDSRQRDRVYDGCVR